MAKRTAPTVSVIIPAYNQSVYINESVQSVLGQTYQDFELIVVDDGSTDETPQILARIQDPRIRIVRQPNSGLSAARNTGLRESSAPLVTFLDSDDYFLPDKLSILTTFLNDHPEVGLVSGGTQFVNEKGQPLSQAIKSPGNLDITKLLVSNPFCVSAIMMHRFWFDRVGMFDETLRACEDWDLWQRMAYAGCQFDWIEHLVVGYRYHDDQMTREAGRMRKAIFAVIDKFFSQPELPENLKDYKNAVYATALVHAAAYAYNASDFPNGQHDLAEAINRDPTLADEQYQKLIKSLVGWSYDPRSSNPTKFLQRIIANPPPGHPGLSRQLRRAMADVMLEPLFSSSRQIWHDHRWDFFKIFIYKPDWLFNRGVLRMFLDAWIPFA
jgi:glycosyltransferase involved in cell wall biosynthesis